MPLSEKMIMLLCDKPVGQIVACNIIAALEENLVKDPFFVQTFLMNCLESFTQEQVDTTEELVAQFEDTARGCRPRNGSKSRSFLFECTKQTNTINSKTGFSTVIEIGTFNEHLIKDSASKSGHTYFLSNPDPADPILKEAIESLNGRSDIYQENAKLGGEKRPFWITPKESIADEKQADQPADAVRDLLGLIHHESKKALIEIQIPGAKLTQHKHARPTFADAGSHRRFRTRPDHVSAKHCTGWGHTVCLEKIALKKTIIDGAPERVVEAMPFNKDLSATFCFIGGTETTRGITSDDNDEAFVCHIGEACPPEQLKKYLLGIFS